MLIVCKCESIRVSDQEHGEIIQWISSWVPIPVKSTTFMKNVSSHLDRIIVIRTLEVFVWEES